jgi:hypothetical protein
MAPTAPLAIRLVIKIQTVPLPRGMVRDAKKSKTNRKNGKNGGNPELKKESSRLTPRLTQPLSHRLSHGLSIEVRGKRSTTTDKGLPPSDCGYFSEQSRVITKQIFELEQRDETTAYQHAHSYATAIEGCLNAGWDPVRVGGRYPRQSRPSCGFSDPDFNARAIAAVEAGAWLSLLSQSPSEDMTRGHGCPFCPNRRPKT